MSGISRNASNYVDDSEGSCFSDCASSDDELNYDYHDPTKILWTFTGNDAILHDISEHIYNFWKEIGRYLLKKESLIENIDMDYDQDGEKEKAYQLLVEWHRMMGTKANVQCLQNVLEHIGRKDVADILPPLYRDCVKLQRQENKVRHQRTKSEIEGHVKLQKHALRALKQGVKFYKSEVREIEEVRSKLLENPEASNVEEQLHLEDIGEIRNKLDSLHTRVYNMEENSIELDELDKQLRYVAKKLYQVEQTVIDYCDKVNDLQITYYSECRFGRLGRIACLFGSLKLPRGSTREKRKPMKTKEIPDKFGSNQKRPFKSVPSQKERAFHKSSTYPAYNKKSEEQKRLSVTSMDIETSEQLQEFITNTQGHETLLYHSLSMDNQDYFQECHIDNLPDPCYESSQTIFSLLTKSSRYTLGQSIMQQDDVWV